MLDGIGAARIGPDQSAVSGALEDVREGFARMYNTNRYLEANAPRSAAVIKQIERLKQCSETLARELCQLSILSARIIFGEAVALSDPLDFDDRLHRHVDL